MSLLTTAACGLEDMRQSLERHSHLFDVIEEVKFAKCACYKGWVWEDHADQPWGMMAAGLRESFVLIESATNPSNSL